MFGDISPVFATLPLPSWGVDSPMTTPTGSGPAEREAWDATMGYMDCPWWRDPTPSLPQFAPAPLQLDRRLRPRPAAPPAPNPTPALAPPKSLPGQTLAPADPNWFRSCHYLDPARDIVDATCRLLDALHQRNAPLGSRGPQNAGPPPSRRQPAEDAALLARRRQIVTLPPWFFYALGNPPLASEKQSEAVMAYWRSYVAVDKEGWSTRMAHLEQAQVRRWVDATSTFTERSGAVFARYVALLLGVAHEWANYGTSEVRFALLADEEGAGANQGQAVYPKPQHATAQTSLARSRCTQLKAMMHAITQDYWEDCIDKAVQDAAEPLHLGDHGHR